MQRFGPTSEKSWRIASRNGSDSMSPTVPPISVITKSTACDSATIRIRCLISSVMWGITWTLAADHRVVDRAGSHVRRPRGVLVGESLVVAEVEIGLRAVLGHEYLAVLERAHRPGVDVDVRVELLDLDPHPTADQEPTDRGRGDPLPEG